MSRVSHIRRAALWVPPIVYMALIFRFSGESNPLPELTARVWDKFLHTSEYGGLAFLFCRALMGEGVAGFVAACGAVLLTSVYGASDEYHQIFVPLRSPDFADWFADTIGAAVGATIYLLARQAWRRKPSTA